MRFDDSQFHLLLSAIESNWFSAAQLIGIFSLIVALASAIITVVIWNHQALLARRRYTADLHSQWWNRDFEEDRAIVWQQLKLWEKERDNAPGIVHYKNPDFGWPIGSPERRAHGRILFFFADLNTLLERKLIDKGLTLEFFGEAQYEWFRDYFDAIRSARVQRDDQLKPRWIEGTLDFEKKLDRWKKSKKLGPLGCGSAT